MMALDEAWWSRVLGGPGGSLHQSSSSERYVLLPRASDPRVVVDADDLQAMRDAVDRFVGTRKRSAVKPLTGGVAAVLSRRKPSWSVSSPTLTLREYLSDVLGREVRLAIAVGPPRPNRKPVARCYANEQLIAVAKLGPDPHTAALVENEGRWLDSMAGSPLTGATTPPLLHRGQYGTSEVLVMGAVDLVDDIGVDFDDVPLRVIRELAERFAEDDPVAESSYFLGLRRRLDRPDLASVAAQAASLSEEGAFQELTVSAWHGDWSPWNIGMLKNGDHCIWDWERAAIGVPKGLDVIHLHHHYGSGIEAADADLTTLSVPRSQWSVLKRLYLFELCARLAEGDALGTGGYQRAIGELDRVRRAIRDRS